MWLTRFLFSLALYLQWLLALAIVPAHCHTPSFNMCFMPLAMKLAHLDSVQKYDPRTGSKSLNLAYRNSSPSLE